MWDDSYDSSPTSLGNNNKKKTTTTKPGATISSNKYDFPETKKSNNRNKSSIKKKSSDNDIDMLFSPSSASESNSPDRYYDKEKKSNTTTTTTSTNNTNSSTYPNYDILLPPKQDDILANMMTASGDFEDSILGELLGGPSKKPNSVSMDTKQSTETTIPPIRPAGGRSPPSTRNAFRFATENSPVSSSASPPPPINRSMTPLHDVISVPSVGTGRPHTNSFDFDYATKTDSPTSMMLDTKNNRMASQGGIKQDNAPSNAGGTTITNTTTSTTSAKQEKNEEEVDLGGFMPSSMEPGRAGRRRR